MDIFQRQWPMFTEVEKEQIRSMKVFVGGVGGLGTNQLIQLQRIGVKKIYFIDRDHVEASNLNRQILYGRGDIGESKVRTAKKKLEEFNLETEIEAIEGQITQDLEIPDDVDIVLDALDNYQARFDLEKAAWQKEKPFVHGAIRSWHGQLTSIIPGKTPRLEEILGENPDSKNEKNGTIPVFSPAVTMVAILQVLEAVKLHLDISDNLANKLLFVDMQDYSLEKIDFN
ncbi:HesA/MoeB/ThiF family protein [Halarsenatibacter silvermanii]|uniref:Molybdopterin or thiamine biosynthesis adenylyltransferase n=1 Tax=Halarsenatibacter silvermanii TaxID=321763 RepID=A0A1G9KNM1_9FIRM|nr:HesA/MoeB/ThiF family protein [Halarsenatibacter silvermanii]SDL51311.1 Molybdopterin or thiamine biosynthesis adenylyltransferase [Halarsenatibacter silvermanii]